jgi:hypothetical protein
MKVIPPYPGSDRAIAEGCTCPPICYNEPDDWAVMQGCPIHTYDTVEACD